MANTCPSSSHIFLNFSNFEAPSPSLSKPKKNSWRGRWITMYTINIYNSRWLDTLNPLQIHVLLFCQKGSLAFLLTPQAWFVFLFSIFFTWSLCFYSKFVSSLFVERSWLNVLPPLLVSYNLKNIYVNKYYFMKKITIYDSLKCMVGAAFLKLFKSKS